MGLVSGHGYNRLQPKGAIILINHRMHEDDLSGRLIEQMKAGNDQWTIVELPAIALDNDQLRRQKGVRGIAPPRIIAL
jgi:hypothetical protein